MQDQRGPLSTRVTGMLVMDAAAAETKAESAPAAGRKAADVAAAEMIAEGAAPAEMKAEGAAGIGREVLIDHQMSTFAFR